jgi:hypothetical protein
MKSSFYPLFLSLFFITSFSSCTDIDERVIPTLGVYRSHVIGLAGPFDLVIAADGNDNISIDAPFDAEFWSVVDADLDDLDKQNVDIDIRNQEIEPNIWIRGDGFINNNTIQLNYTIDFGGYKEKFRIVGTKFR